MGRLCDFGIRLETCPHPEKRDGTPKLAQSQLGRNLIGNRDSIVKICQKIGLSFPGKSAALKNLGKVVKRCANKIVNCRVQGQETVTICFLRRVSVLS